MAIINRSAYLRLDARGRPRLGDQGVSSAMIMGAIHRNAPAKVNNVSMVGSIGIVQVFWDHVTSTNAGKPLEALSRYIVLYKYSATSPVPLITWEDNDGLIYVDNNTISFPIGRVEQGGVRYTQVLGVRIAAMDRYGRIGELSDQVEGTTLFAKVPSVLDWGTVTSYDPGSEGGIEYTIVRQYPVITVPPGYYYVVTVFPLGELPNYPQVQDVDFGPWCSNLVYGLFWIEGQSGPSWPYLPEGTHINVELMVSHANYSSAESTCYNESGETNQPQLQFNPNRSDMLLAGRLYEGGPGDFFFPQSFYGYTFQPVYWILWQIPL